MAGMDYRQRKVLILPALFLCPCYKCSLPTARFPFELSASAQTVPASSTLVVVAFPFASTGHWPTIGPVRSVKDGTETRRGGLRADQNL